MGLASPPIYFPSLILAPIARKLAEFRVRSDGRKMPKRFSALSRYPTLTLDERQHVMDRDPQTGLGIAPEHARNMVDAVYRSDSRHVLATLIRLRYRRRGIARRFQGGFGAMAARWSPRQSTRLARVDRPFQGDRRNSPAQPIHAVAGRYRQATRGGHR